MLLIPALLSAFPVLAPQNRPLPPETPAQLGWSFVEANYLVRDVDAADDDGKGFGARGAWEFGDGLFVHGAAERLSSGLGIDRYEAGLGHHVALRDDIDAFVKASWVAIEVDDAGPANFDENGWRVEGGLRMLFETSIEFELRGGYQDVADDGLLFGGDLRWWLMPNIAASVGYERVVDDDVWMLSLRYGF